VHSVETYSHRRTRYRSVHDFLIINIEGERERGIRENVICRSLRILKVESRESSSVQKNRQNGRLCQWRDIRCLKPGTRDENLYLGFMQQVQIRTIFRVFEDTCSDSETFPRLFLVAKPQKREF